MDPATAAEALRQVRDGRDFQSPAKVLARVAAKDACRTLPEFGYSLATYVLHTDFWQVMWLGRLRGGKTPSITEDWRVAQEHEWEDIRRQFLANFDACVQLAENIPFAHQLKRDDRAVAMLLQIAVHNAYHVGQFVLIKRALRRGTAED